MVVGQVCNLPCHSQDRQVTNLPHNNSQPRRGTCRNRGSLTLCQDRLHELSVDIGQAIATTLELERETLVINP
jgi:hypothetical protein